MTQKVQISNGDGRFIRGTPVGANQARPQMAGHDETTSSNRTGDIDPVDQHDLTVEALNDTAQPDGTNVEAIFDLAHCGQFSAQVVDIPGAAGTNTYTLEISNEDDGTAPGSVAWIDTTAQHFSAASFTTDFHETCQIPCKAKWGRIKRVRSADGGASDGGSLILIRKGP